MIGQVLEHSVSKYPAGPTCWTRTRRIHQADFCSKCSVETSSILRNYGHLVVYAKGSLYDLTVFGDFWNRFKSVDGIWIQFSLKKSMSFNNLKVLFLPLKEISPLPVNSQPALLPIISENAAPTEPLSDAEFEVILEEVPIQNLTQQELQDNDALTVARGSNSADNIELLLQGLDELDFSSDEEDLVEILHRLKLENGSD